MIRFDKVDKTYKTGVHALKETSFVIEDGEFVFIIGKSGSGKSTLLKCITCEEQPTDGSVYIDNFDISNMSRALIPILRRQLGMIYQDFRLISSKTVKENVAFAGEIIGAEKKTIRNTAKFVLDMVGLSGKENCYPDELSGGEQQRVAIARALFNNPKIIVADEPTGNLDPQTSENIMSLLLDINQSGTTVIVCTHDSNLVDKMKKRVIELASGVVIRDQYDADYLGTDSDDDDFGGYDIDAEDSIQIDVEEIDGIKDNEESTVAEKLDLDKKQNDFVFGDKDDKDVVIEGNEDGNVTDEDSASVSDDVGVEDVGVEDLFKDIDEQLDKSAITDEVTTNTDDINANKLSDLDIPELDNGRKYFDFKVRRRRQHSVDKIKEELEKDNNLLEDEE